MTEGNKEILTGEILDRLTKFIEDNDMNRISRNLRRIFFDYLRQQSAGLELDFHQVLNDVENIIDLLEYFERK